MLVVCGDMSMSRKACVFAEVTVGIIFRKQLDFLGAMSLLYPICCAVLLL